jgi:hypothetical protein
MATAHRAASMLRKLDGSQHRAVLDRMEKLGLPAWKDAVRAVLFRLLVSDSQEHLLEDALQALSKYEQWERLALLELAIWKVVCLSRMPNIKNDYTKAVAWLSSG